MQEAQTSFKMAKCLPLFANALKWIIIWIQVLHDHIFLLIAGILPEDNMTGRCLIISIGPLVSPSIAVYLINNVAGAYSHIQWWQISWIIWGVSYSFILIGFGVYPRYSTLEGRDAYQEYWTLLLFPFGIQPKTTIMCKSMYIPSLISVAPAIVGGYVAEFCLETTYTLKCDVIYNTISDICEDGVCCITRNNYEDWIYVVPQIASSVLTAWGIVKATGIFILAHEPRLEVENTKQRLHSMDAGNLETNVRATNIESEQGDEEDKLL